jgi:hypothetical protein
MKNIKDKHHNETFKTIDAKDLTATTGGAWAGGWSNWNQGSWNGATAQSWQNWSK